MQNMDDEKLHILQEYLRRDEVQRRVQERMRFARANATVTISRAASLFEFSEQQLRDWERRGLVTTERVFTTIEDGKTVRGHRQYSFEELDKLALIKELMEYANMASTDIPANIDDIWSLVREDSPKLLQGEELVDARRQVQVSLSSASIDTRIDAGRNRLFWRYFASHILRLVCLLVREDNLGTPIGLILPLRQRNVIVQSVQDLEKLGTSLVGWLGQSLASQTLLTSKPHFDYEGEYGVVPLRSMKNGVAQDDTPQDSTLIIVKRKKRETFTLSKETVAVIRTLLSPLYDAPERSRESFGLNMFDVLEPAPDLNNSALYPDLILNELTDLIVQLGGRVERQNRWDFCCILSPKDQSRLLRQQSLVVQAQSKNAPYRIGVTTVGPEEADLNNLSLRAFRSGCIAYRPIVLAKDATFAFHVMEPDTLSAVAVPIGGENGHPLGVLYVASKLLNAFDEAHYRVLRMMSRMIEERFHTFQARQQEAKGLGNLLLYPDTVDTLFKDFASENDFIRDLEAVLNDIHNTMSAELVPFVEVASAESETLNEDLLSQPEVQEENVLSFIAIDVDNLSLQAAKYGDDMVRNLCREVGWRIQGELKSFFEKYNVHRLYHIYADRFYILLNDVSLNKVREKVSLLKKSLVAPYMISVLPTEYIHLPTPDMMIDVKDIKIRFVISAYSRKTVEDLLRSYQDNAVSALRQMMSNALSTQLKKAIDAGGNIILSWDPKERRYKKLDSSDTSS